MAESVLEADLLAVFRAWHAVRKIWDQPPAREYVTKDGEVKSHTFDFLVEFWSGRRIAYPVKSTRYAAIDGIEETLELIRNQSLDGFADDVVLVTEKEVPRRVVHNAREVLRARRMRNAADVEHVRRIVFDLQGDIRLEDLVHASGLGARGRNAVICLIDEGDVQLASPRIQDDAVLTPAPVPKLPTLRKA